MNSNMQLIIYDTEFTAWEGSAQRNWNYDWEARELIQFAGIKLHINDSDVHEIGVIDHFVQPQKNPQLSPYIKHLTKITQENVDDGLAPNDLFNEISAFTDNGNIPMASWGNDIIVLQETAEINSLTVDWVNSHNLMEVFDLFNVNTQVNSCSLHKQFNLNLNLKEHNALDDTVSLVESLKYLHRKDAKTVVDYIAGLQQKSS